MELERWAELSAAVSAVAADFGRHPRDTYSTATIVRVHLWAALFDRSTSWACRAVNWKPCTRPAELPDQSTMSRRTRRGDFELFLERVGKRLGGKAAPGLVRVVDGKPLELPNHTTDRDATWGRGVSRTSVGYKFHAVFSGGAMPDAFAVTTLAVSEKDMAARMVGRLGATAICWPTPTSTPVGCSTIAAIMASSWSARGPSPARAPGTTTSRHTGCGRSGCSSRRPG